MKRASTIVGFLALTCLVSLAYADSCTNSAPSTITTYCSTTAAPTNPSSFIAATGNPYMDTINWQVNADESIGNPGTYSDGDFPYFANDGLGAGGSSYPSPPYGGGVNGTGYTFGYVPGSAGGNNDLSLGLANTFYSMPSSNQNLLAGTLNSSEKLALTWDTSTTDTYYNNSADAGACASTYSPSCFTSNGSYTGAGIYGLGFDVQLNPFGVLEQWTVTFNIYSQASGCDSGSTAVIQNPVGDTAIDCYNYANGSPTNASGGSSGAGVLLGTVTVDSDTSGDAAFFGFTSTTAIGAVVETGYTSQFGDLAQINFAVDDVTLLAQQAPTGTPEPATLLLFGSGLLIAARRLRKQASK